MSSPPRFQGCASCRCRPTDRGRGLGGVDRTPGDRSSLRLPADSGRRAAAQPFLVVAALTNTVEAALVEVVREVSGDVAVPGEPAEPRRRRRCGRLGCRLGGHRCWIGRMAAPRQQSPRVAGVHVGTRPGRPTGACCGASQVVVEVGACSLRRGRPARNTVAGSSRPDVNIADSARSSSSSAASMAMSAVCSRSCRSAPPVRVSAAAGR